MSFVKQFKSLVLAVPLLLASPIATAQIEPGTPEAQRDWEARVLAPAVMYATNFDDVYLDGVRDPNRSGIASKADIKAEAYELGSSKGKYDHETAIKLSGAGSLRLYRDPDDGSNAGSWAFRPDGRTSAVRNKFYFQIGIRFSREDLAWKNDHNDAINPPKVIKFGQFFENGEFLIINGRQGGFIGAQLNGSNGASRKLTTDQNGPFVGEPTAIIQNAVYPQGDLTGFSTIRSALSTVGPVIDRSSGERWLGGDGGDYDYIKGNEYLDVRTSVAPHGFPNTAAKTSAVSWEMDGWVVVEVFLDASTDRAKVWAAKYGEPPKLIIDTQYSTDALKADPASHYNYIQLLNYITSGVTDASRPIQNRYYDELIVSGQPINFPGGYGLDGSGSGGGSGVSSLRNVSAPSWVTAIEPGTWSTISLNTLDDVDPADDPNANPNFPNSAPWSGNSGQGAVIGAWNGAALAYGFGSYGSLIAYGGGHGDYYGSEVYAFDLGARTWRRLTDPYPGPFNWPYYDGDYPDGSAIPPHTYDFVSYHPSTNSFVLMKGQYELGPPSNQTSLDIPHMFDFDTLEWRRGPENLDDPDLYSGGYSAYDSKRDLFWAHGGNGGDNLVAYDPNGQNNDGTFGSWSTYAKTVSVTDSQAVYDPVNDLLLITTFRDFTHIAALDLTNPNAQRIKLVESGDVPDKKSAHGWSWSSTRGAVLYFSSTNGANVYEFKHESGTWKDGVWAWRKLTSTRNTLTPETPSTGIYSKFQVVSYADAEIVVMVSGTKRPVYAFRVPEPVRPNPPVLD